MINWGRVKDFGLDVFVKDIQNIEYQYLNLIYHPLFDKVCGRDEYERTKELIEWNCAICGEKILTNKRRTDVENFVCDKCKESHNNKKKMVDFRILSSRTKMYKMLEDNLYKELEDNLNKGRGD